MTNDHINEIVYATHLMGEKVYAFGLTHAERLRHVHVLGKAGMGKTTLLRALFDQDRTAKRPAFFFRCGDFEDVRKLEEFASRLRPASLFVDDAAKCPPRLLARFLETGAESDVCVTFAHRALADLEKKFRERVFDLVGTIIAFRLGPADAPLVARTMGRSYPIEQFLTLRPHHLTSNAISDGLPAANVPMVVPTRSVIEEKQPEKEIPEALLRRMLNPS